MQPQSNDTTQVANISELLVELKENRELDFCSSWRRIRETRPPL